MSKNEKQADPVVKTEFSSLVSKIKRRTYRNTDSLWREKDNEKSHSERNNDLLLYALQGNKKMVIVALNGGVGANLYATDSHGNNALILAVVSGASEVVSYLLETGMDPNRLNNDGLSALHVAVRKNKYNIVKKLLEYGADVNLVGQFNQTPLFDAVIENNTEMINLLHDFSNGKLDVNVANREGRTPLMVACHNKNRQESLVKLIKLGADLNASDKNGRTAFLHATNNDFGIAMDILLKLNPDCMDDTDEEGITASMICAKRGNREGLRVLVMKGANIYTTDKNGKDAFAYAEKTNCRSGSNHTCMEIITRAKRIYEMQVSDIEKLKLFEQFGKQNKVQNSCVN